MRVETLLRRLKVCLPVETHCTEFEALFQLVQRLCSAVDARYTTDNVKPMRYLLWGKVVNLPRISISSAHYSRPHKWLHGNGENEQNQVSVTLLHGHISHQVNI